MNKGFTLVLIMLISLVAFSQDKENSKEDLLKKANNPLADMTAFNIHNYYAPKLTDAPNEAYLNTSWLRYARPFASGKLLLRVSLPISTVGIPDGLGSVRSLNGLGDANAFLSYNFVSKPNKTVGVGPLVVAPTASENELGSGKWQGGAAFVAFIANSPIFQFGSLITWQASFAGDETRDNTNLAAVQPFYFWQLGKGTYIRGAPIWVFNIEKGTYQVPMGLGIGKVAKVENTVFNLFIEPQYTVIHFGVQPQFQLFAGINMQFISKP